MVLHPHNDQQLHSQLGSFPYSGQDEDTHHGGRRPRLPDQHCVRQSGLGVNQGLLQGQKSRRFPGFLFMTRSPQFHPYMEPYDRYTSMPLHKWLYDILALHDLPCMPRSTKTSMRSMGLHAWNFTKSLFNAEFYFFLDKFLVLTMYTLAVSCITMYETNHDSQMGQG